MKVTQSSSVYRICLRMRAGIDGAADKPQFMSRGRDRATLPNACFPTPVHYAPIMLVASTRSWPFLIIPGIRPRGVVAMDGGDHGDSHTQEGSDLSRRADAAYRLGSRNRRLA